jgi:hypothetical protein
MTLAKLTLMLFLFFITGLCQAQVNVPVTADTTKKEHAFLLYNFFHHSYHKENNLNTRTLLLWPTFKDQPILRLVDYTPAITPQNFNYFSRPDYYRRYDPTNPYGVVNPADGIFLGSIDYLMGKLLDIK